MIHTITQRINVCKDFYNQFISHQQTKLYKERGSVHQTAKNGLLSEIGITIYGHKYKVSYDRITSTGAAEQISYVNYVIDARVNPSKVIYRESAIDIYKPYMDLMKQGIRLVFIDNPIVSTDYIQELAGTAKKSNIITETAMESTVKLLLIVELNRVEEERKNISKRIKDGIAASEKKTGECRKGKVFKLDESLREDIKKYLTDRTIKKSDLLKNRKMSPNTLDKYIKIVKKEMEEEAPED